MNNNAKFDELEFLDENNDEKDERDHVLVFH